MKNFMRKLLFKLQVQLQVQYHHPGKCGSHIHRLVRQICKKKYMKEAVLPLRYLSIDLCKFHPSEDRRKINEYCEIEIICVLTDCRKTLIETNKSKKSSTLPLL
jgi:hypothetical protein